jgi:hypothetical protein
MTDLRGLQTFGNDDRSHFAATGTVERMRAGNPLRMALEPDDLAGAYLPLLTERCSRHHWHNRDG